MKFLRTIGSNATAHYYEAQVSQNGERVEIEIQANNAGQARDTAKAEGLEILPGTLKFVC